MMPLNALGNHTLLSPIVTILSLTSTRETKQNQKLTKFRDEIPKGGDDVRFCLVLSFFPTSSINTNHPTLDSDVLLSLTYCYQEQSRCFYQFVKITHLKFRTSSVFIRFLSFDHSKNPPNSPLSNALTLVSIRHFLADFGLTQPTLFCRLHQNATVQLSRRHPISANHAIASLPFGTAS